MKNRLLFLCLVSMMGGGALTAQADDASKSNEPVPSLVVHHYYGVDTYPVALTDK